MTIWAEGICPDQCRTDRYVAAQLRNISNGHIKFVISKCPWHDIIVRSDRTHFSDKIGGVICKTEYGVWSSEFGPGIKFEFGKKRICREDSCCILYFKINKDKK